MNTSDLTHGSVWKVIIRFALPLLIGNLLQQLYNITDSIIVGQFLGKEALFYYIIGYRCRKRYIRCRFAILRSQTI